MKITSFMTVYKMKKTDEDKINELKKHIKTEYIPYEQKADMAKAIIQASCYKKNKDNQSVLYVDSISQYMLKCMALIDLFTDLERSKQDGKMLEEFNLLNSNLIFDMIIQCVDQRELKEFNMLVEMTYDDLMTNEYEPHAFLKGQVERFGELIGVALAPVIDSIDIDKIQKIINDNNSIVDKGY